MSKKSDTWENSIEKYRSYHNTINFSDLDSLNRKISGKRSNTPWIVIALLLLISLGYLALKEGPSFIGYVTYGEAQELEINHYFAEDENITLQLNYSITSLRVSGELIGDGSAFVYLNFNNTRYLISEIKAATKTTIADYDLSMEKQAGANTTGAPPGNESRTSSTFSSLCFESCSLTGIGGEITIEARLNGTELNLTKITYTYEQKRIDTRNPIPYWNSSVESFVVDGETFVSLTKYFVSDYSKDLSYLTTSADNLSIDVDGDSLRINLLNQFNGERIITVYASDGNYTGSKEIRLIVNSSVTNISFENASINYTFPAIIPPSNTSNKSLPIANITGFNDLQGKAVIGEPVVWTRRIRPNSTNFTVDVPANAKNVKVFKLKGGERKEAANSKIDEVLINETVEEIEISYETEAPTATEKELTKYRKQIFVNSETSYANILTFSNIPKTRQGGIRLYWFVSPQDYKKYFGEERKDTTKLDVTKSYLVNLTYEDLDSDGLIDQIQWLTPHLSNQTFEVSITILNVQSYPTLGGNWTVTFNTTGVANLTISASNGTTYGNETPFDLKPLVLRCGDSLVNASFDGSVVFIRDWNCSLTGYHTVKVLTTGTHNQKFVFGDNVEYAHNWVKTGTKYECKNCSDCNAAIAAANAGDTVVLNESIIDYGNTLSEEMADTCIVFNGKDKVTFDCNRSVIDGDADSYGYGIWVNQSNGGSNGIIIQNCTNIRDFGLGMKIFKMNSSILRNINMTCSQYGITGYSWVNVSAKNIQIKGMGSMINGIYLSGTGNNNFGNRFTGITIQRCTFEGFYFDSSQNNSVENVSISNCVDGLKILAMRYSNFSGITTQHNTQYGIQLGASSPQSTRIILRNSRIINNTLYGFFLDGMPGLFHVTQGRFYNNFFNNTVNMYSDDPDNVNSWNMSKNCNGVGSNIVGGICTGGNYWTDPQGGNYSDTCTDSNLDGICDSSYTPQTGDTDYLPLAKSIQPDVVLISPSTGSYKSGNFTARCDATAFSGKGIKNISFYGNFTGTWKVNRTVVFTTGKPSYYSANFTVNASLGSYRWNCLAYDNGSLRDWAAANWTFYRVSYYSCLNCSDCSSVIAGRSPGDLIKLTMNITNYAGTNDGTQGGETCIKVNGKDNFIFDCNYNRMTGDNDAAGLAFRINNSNAGSYDILIRNCINLSRFAAGIAATNCTRCNFTNIDASFSQGSGISDYFGRNNTYRNIISNNNLYSGFNFQGPKTRIANFIRLYNVTARSNAYYGIGMANLTYSSITDAITSSNSQAGVSTCDFLASKATWSDNLSLTRITSYSNPYNLYIISKGSKINESRIYTATTAGIIIVNDSTTRFSTNNKFYNNFLNNTVNVQSTGKLNKNIWNTTKNCTKGYNIINGRCFGGNYFTDPKTGNYSDTCTDANWDGICDLKYNATQYNNTDYLPLAKSICDKGDIYTTCNISSTKAVANTTALNFKKLKILNGGILNCTRGQYMRINASQIEIYSGGKIKCNAIIQTVNMTVYSGGIINQTGLGHRGATVDSANGNGPGGGGSSTARGGGGAGYGGTGGSVTSGGTAGVYYSLINSPTLFGSGGGAGDGALAGTPGQDWGGDGGGYVVINVTNIMQFNGTIYSNGKPGLPGVTSTSFDGGGGGSGGSVYMASSVLRGNGIIYSNGGAGGGDDTTMYGGGAAGGRIAIYYSTEEFKGQTSILGGQPGGSTATAGKNGTAFIIRAASGVSCYPLAKKVLCALSSSNVKLVSNFSINNSVRINRTINPGWTTGTLKWNDTSSVTSCIAVYNITGVTASRRFDMYNNSLRFRNQTSTAAGTLALFPVKLGSKHEIRAQGAGWLNVTSISNPQNNTLVSLNGKFSINASVKCLEGNCSYVRALARYSNWTATPDKNISNTTGAKAFFTNTSNPKACGMMPEGSKCNVSWRINATGPGIVTYFVDVKFYSNVTSVPVGDSENRRVCVGSCSAYGALNTSIDRPLNNTAAPRYSIFTVNTTIKCLGTSGQTCGMVYGGVRYNKSSSMPNTYINVSGNATPFYIINYSGGSMNPVRGWNRTFTYGATAWAVATDRQNNIVVVGSPTVSQFLTVKYNSSGNRSWNQSFTFGKEARGVAVDSQDNIIVTGYKGTSPYDFLTAKYSSSGTIIWNRTYAFGNQTRAVAIDSNNNIIIAGYTDNIKFLTIKYNSTGGLLWNRTFEKGYKAQGVTTDSQDNVIAVGYNKTGTTNDIWVVKYNSSGKMLWNKSDTYGKEATTVATDSGNNIYVGGHNDGYIAIITKYSPTGTKIWNQSFYAGPASASYTQGAAVDSQNNIIWTGYAIGIGYTTFKYNSTGSQIWNLNNSFGNQANGITIDTQDNIIVTGKTSTPDFLTIKYLQGKNPQHCPTMTPGQTCNLTWVVNATGPTDSAYYVDIYSYSNASAVGTNDSQNRRVCIGTSCAATGTLNSSIDRPLNNSAVYRYGIFTVNTSVKCLGGAGKRCDVVYSGVRYNKSSTAPNTYVNTSLKSPLPFSIRSYRGGDTQPLFGWNRTDTTGDNAYGVAVDSQDNVIITGYDSGTNYRTIKYNSAGSLLWNRTDTTGDNAYGVAVDSQDNIIITGSDSTTDYRTVKYNSAGSVLWNRTDTKGVSALAVVVDSQDNIIITGFDSGTNFRTIKYNSTGNRTWNRTDTTGQAAYAVAVDSQDNVIITGYDSGTNYRTIKYNSAGSLLWNRTDTTGDNAYGVVVDSQDNIIITGKDSSLHYRTIKYNSAGSVLWNRTDTTGNSALAVAVDSQDKILITGFDSSNHYRTIKYNSSGSVLWNRTDTTGTTAWSVAVDSQDNVIITGYDANSNYLTVKYLQGKNPQKCPTLFVGQSCNLTWVLNATGATWRKYFLDVYSYSNDSLVGVNDSQNRRVCIGPSCADPGVTNSSIYHPPNNTAVLRYALFTVNSSVKCLGRAEQSCDVVYGGVRYNKSSSLPNTYVNTSKKNPAPFKIKSYGGGDTQPAFGWNLSDATGYAAYAVAVDSNDNIVVTGRDDLYYYRTVKYNSTGSKLWNRTDTSGWAAYGVAADSSGNTIITGFDGAIDYRTVKYNSTGGLLWTKTYAAGSYARGVAVDSSNNVIITGRDGNYQYRTVKYDSAGNLLWNMTDNGGYYAYGVTVDSSDNVIITGTDGSSYRTDKYNSTGSIKWTKTYTSGNSAYGVTVDSSDNVIITGRDANQNYRTVKYDSAGNLLWNRTDAAGEIASSVAVDSLDNIIITGNDSNSDYRIVKYNSTGSLLWNWTYKYGSFAYGVAVDSQDNIIVTGSNNSYNNYLTIKYLQGKNPQRCPTLNGGQSCNLTWVLNATGPVGSRYWFDVYSYSNDSLISANDSKNRKVCIGSCFDVVFVSKTPGNDVQQISNWIYSNVTISGAGIVDQCWLRWNNQTHWTNYSMTKTGSGSSVYCMKNLSTKDGFRYNYSVFVNDTVDNVGYSVYRTNLENSKPTMSKVNVTPDYSYDSDNLNCTAVGASDPEGDSLQYHYKWYNNSILIRSVLKTAASDILGAGNTTKRNSWNCTVKPYDGYENGTASSDKVTVGEPKIDLISPSNGGIFVSPVLFKCNVSAGTYIKNISLFTNSTGTWKLNSSLNIAAIKVSEYKANFTVATSLGGIKWNCRASDNMSRLGWASSNWTFRAIIPGVLNVTIEHPLNNTAVARLGTFVMNGTVRCTGANAYCGNVFGFARYNTSAGIANTLINNTKDAIPIFVQDYSEIKWDKTFNRGNRAYGVAVDSQNNVIVGGYNTSASGRMLVVKYNSSGSVLWNRTFAFGYIAFGIAVDSQNNVIAAGYNTGNRLLVVKFNSSGSVLWNRSFEKGSRAYAVAVDSQDNIIAAGYNTSNRLLVVKYSSSGSVLWNRTFGKGTYAYGVAVDSQDNIIAAGYNTSSNLLVVKYSGTGNILWNRTFARGNFAYGVAVDSQDNIIAAGSNTSNRLLVVKYSGSGSVLWNRSFGKGSRAQGVAVDSQDNIIVAGYNTSTRLLVIKYSGTGNMLWNRTFGKGSYAYAVALDSQESIITAGQNTSTRLIVLKYLDWLTRKRCDGLSSGGICNVSVVVSPTTATGSKFFVDFFANSSLGSSLISFANSSDRRVCVGPCDTATVNVGLIRPLAGGVVNRSVLFSCNVSGNGINNLSLWTNMSGVWQANSTLGFAPSLFVSKNFSMIFPFGSFKWACSAFDDIAGNVKSSNQTFRVVPGVLNVSLIRPLNNSFVVRNGLFLVNTTVFCMGESGSQCGSVNGLVRNNQSSDFRNVNMSRNAKPVFLRSSYYSQKGSEWNMSFAMGTLSRGVAVDSQDNVIVVGINTSTRFLVIKYSGSGSVLWNRTFLKGQYAYGVAVDSQDNVIVAGYNTTTYWLVVKYNSSGSVLWDRTFAKGTLARGVAVDSQDNIIAAGYNTSTYWLVVKYNSSGSVLWNSTFAKGAIAYGVAVDSQDNIFASGRNKTNLWLVVKYSSSGSVLWSRTFPRSSYVYGVAVDSQDNVIAAGYNTSNYLRVVKYSGAGSVLWNRTFARGLYAYGVAVDSQDNVIAAGQNISSRWLVVKYSSSGSVLWNRTSTKGSIAYGVAVDSQDNVIVAGYNMSNKWLVVKYPFGRNPLACGDMFYGGSCGLWWYLNASGNIGSRVVLNTFLNSSYSQVAPKNSSNVFVTIGGALNVSLNNPTNGEVNNGSIVFKCNATAELYLKNISLYTNSSGILGLNQTLVLTGNKTNTYKANFTKAISEGSVKWNCLAYDNLSSGRWAANNWTFRVRPAVLNVTIDRPLNNTAVSRYGIFTVNASVKCLGSAGRSCAVVYGTVRYNKSSSIPNTYVNSSLRSPLPFSIKNYRGGDSQPMWGWNRTDAKGEEAYDVAVDSRDNIIITGPDSSGNYRTIKYNSSGSVLWNRTDTKGDVAIGVAVDSQDNIIITGKDSGTDYRTIKYNSSGSVLWNRTDTTGDWAYSVAVDSQDNIIITGQDSSEDYRTIKYNSSGSVLWNRTDTKGDWVLGVAVDSQDNIIITGWDSGTNYRTIKYNSTGNRTWNRTDTKGDYARDVAVDSQDNIIITGPDSSGNYRTIKYNSSGSVLWNRTDTKGDYAYGVAVDSQDNIIITGQDSTVNYRTIKYNSTGSVLWNRTDTKGDFAEAIAVDSQDNIIITGYDADTNYRTVKYLQGKNPQRCPTMTAGQSCNLTWVLNATGTSGTKYWMDVYSYSNKSNVAANDSRNRRVCIGTSCGGANNAPSISVGPIITPTIPGRNRNLNCSFTVTDSDVGDTLYANFTWYNGSDAKFKGRISVTKDVLTSIRLTAANTTYKDWWNCTITPYDSTDYGDKKSAKVYINNSMPNVTLVWPNAGNDSTYNRTPMLRWRGNDSDQETLNYTLRIKCIAATCAPYLDNLEVNITAQNYTLQQELAVDKPYNWTVRVYDGLNRSSWPKPRNFTIASRIVLAMTRNATNFGTLFRLDQRNTTVSGDSYYPFIVRNDGNIYTDIKIRALKNLWSAATLNTSYFQFMVGNATAAITYNMTIGANGSQRTWGNVSNADKKVIDNLNYSSRKNNATIEFKIIVPFTESPGTKNSGLQITGKAS